MLVLGGVPVVSAPHETRKTLTPRAVPDIAPLVCAEHFDFSSDKYCTDFKCPEYYDLVEDADTTVCEDRKCTKDVCCEKECETPNEYLFECIKTILTDLFEWNYLWIYRVYKGRKCC